MGSSCWRIDGSRPDPRATWPTLLIRTPYGRRIMGPLGRLFAERGYQTVIQSCRGTFGSAGAWEPLRHERSDGHATLSWLAGQPWFDGRLVTWGASYLGMTQWAVAADPPELPQGDGARRDRGKCARRVRLSRRIVCPRDGAELGLPDQASGARVPHRAVDAAPQRQGGGAGRRGAAARPGRRRGRGRAGAGVPGLARAQRARRRVVGRDRLQPPTGPRSARQLRGRLVRPLPGGPGCRLRSGPLEPVAPPG